MAIGPVPQLIGNANAPQVDPMSIGAASIFAATVATGFIFWMSYAEPQDDPTLIPSAVFPASPAGLPPAGPGYLVWNVSAEPQEDPNSSYAAVFKAALTPPPAVTGRVPRFLSTLPQADTSNASWITRELPLAQGFLSWQVSGGPQDDPTQVQASVFRAPKTIFGTVVPFISAAAPQNVDLTIQGHVYPSAINRVGPVLKALWASPQTVDLTIQGKVWGTPTAPTGAVPALVSVGQADPTQIQGFVTRPYVAAPIVPGPIAGFFTTLPQFEDRPTRADFPVARKGSTPRPIPLITASPQKVDLSPQGAIWPAVQKAQGRVPPIVVGQPPQQDLGVAGRIFSAAPIRAPSQVKFVVAGPQSLDLTIQGWSTISPVGPGGGATPFVTGFPPQQDLTIQGSIWATAPGAQGILGAMVATGLPLPDLTIQPSLDPCLAVPYAYLLYGYTLIEITALSQLPFPVAQSTFIENGTCVVEAQYFNQVQSLFVPESIQYMLNDVETGFTILDWTPIIPSSTSSSVIITAAQNAMISTSRMWENHQILFQVVDGSGNTYNARKIFTIRRVPGFSGWTPPDCP